MRCALAVVRRVRNDVRRDMSAGGARALRLWQSQSFGWYPTGMLKNRLFSGEADARCKLRRVAQNFGEGKEGTGRGQGFRVEPLSAPCKIRCATVSALKRVVRPVRKNRCVTLSGAGSLKDGARCLRE